MTCCREFVFFASTKACILYFPYKLFVDHTRFQILLLLLKHKYNTQFIYQTHIKTTKDNHVTHNYCWLQLCYLKNTSSMATTAGTTYWHCCRPFSRGTFLVLVMSCLLYAAHWLVYSSIESRVTDTYKIVLDFAHYILWVLLPVTGWVAESWLGRYRAIVIGLIMCTLALLLLQVALMTLQLLGLVSMLIISAALIIGTMHWWW